MRLKFHFCLLFILKVCAAQPQCTAPSIPVVSHDTTICQNSSVLLTLSGNLNSATNWYWYSDSCGGSLVGIGTLAFMSPFVTTVYYVRGEGGCVNPGACATVTITVKLSPVIDHSAEVITPADCGGTNGAISGVTASGTGPVQYSWDGNPFSSSSGLTNAAAGVHTLEAKDPNGCSAYFSDVINNPAPPVTDNSGLLITNPACGTANGSISGVQGTGTPTITYSWDGGTTYSTTSTLNGASAGIYHLQVKDGHNCTADQTYTITSSSGNTTPAPTVSGPSQITCPASITLTISNPCTNCSYSWTISSGLTGNGNTFNISASNLSNVGVYGYFVLVTDGNGCQNSSSSSFTVNATSQINVSPQTATGCSPLCVAFSNTATASGTCQWDFADGTISTNCYPYHCYAEPGIYKATLKMTDASGCATRDTSTISVYSVPNANFSASPQPTTINNSTINFTDYSNHASIVAWNWNFGTSTSNTSTLQNPSFTFQDTGTYFVQLQVVSNYGCIDSVIKSIRIDPAIGISVSSDLEFELHPNPVSNILVVRAKTSIGVVSIINSRGEIILIDQNTDNTAFIDISGLPNGIYLLRRQNTQAKFVKQ